MNIYKITDFHWIIYNRWGQLVYESKDTENGELTVRGKIQGSGVYIWQFRFKRKDIDRYLKGTVCLIS